MSKAQPVLIRGRQRNKKLQTIWRYFYEKEVLGYSKNLGYWKLYVDIENSEVQQVEVSGQTAEMYSSDSNGGTKHLVWIDRNTDCAFFISANLPKDTIIRIAESVEAVQ